MNAHNEQLLISSLQAAATGNTTTLKMMELCGAAAKALSSNPTNQPAAAQEAVGWFTDDYLTDKSATTYDPLVAERWRKKGWPVTAIYVAPVTAAPAIEALKRIKLRLHFVDMPGESMWDRGDGVWVPDWRYEIQLIEHVLHGSPIKAAEKPTDTRKRIEVEGTPAAPGIDHAAMIRSNLRSIRSMADSLPKSFALVSSNIGHEIDHAMALLDASPKGTTLNEQFGSAEGLGSASGREAHYRQALERIATQGPHYGPDGTRETWKHWSDIARDALVDSPKGGSEAITDTDRLNFIAAGFLHIEPVEIRASEDDADAGWVISEHHMRQGLVELIRWDNDNLRAAIDAAMHAQASDAEVRP